MDTKQTSQTPRDRAALQWMGGLMSLGLVVILGVAAAAASYHHFASMAGSSLLVAGASAVCGGLLGFLFGIPRALQSDDGSAPGDLLHGARPSGDRNITYRANTNLEQISDWLTKILVGVGLTQLTDLPEKMNRLGAFLAPAFPTLPNPAVYSVAVVLFYGIGGFLVAYLWTRLFLGEALREADVAALGEKISELERQTSRDARALSLAQRQLNRRPDAPPVPQEELAEALSMASPSVKTTVYYQAWDVRGRNWRDDKEKMESTIPIFRALAASDVGDEYHANHAQLGYALKDKRNPDWEEAEKALTKAISIRGDWRSQGWRFYEFNRAICRIQLQKKLPPNDPRAEAYTEGILADLRAAISSDDILELIQRGEASTQAIRDWIGAHNISLDSLRS